MSSRRFVLLDPDGTSGGGWMSVLFEGHLRGPGIWNHVWPDDERDRLRGLVGAVRCWACDGTTEKPHPLQSDESRIQEADVVWVPVITPDGPGVLVWLNSD